MSKIAKTKPEAITCFLVGSRSGFSGFGKTFASIEWLRQISKKNDLPAAIEQSHANSLWIVHNESWINQVLRATTGISSRHHATTSLGDLILCEAPLHNEILPSLHGVFRRVIGEVPSFKMLPSEELAEVLSSDNKEDLFIGGAVDVQNGILTLTRGNLHPLVVPLSFFQPTIDSKPDFDAFELDDCGYTIRFGTYEASAHSVLYELDASYRRRVNKQRTEEEKGFGASLRRLRLLRGLNQDQIKGVSSKTIARLERDKTKPQKKTLSKVAKALDVLPEEIEDY